YAPVDDFELSVCRLERDPGRDLRGRGPRVLLAAEGQVAVSTTAQQRWLKRGQAAFVAADEGPVRVAGDGVLVQADVPWSVRPRFPPAGPARPGSLRAR